MCMIFWPCVWGGGHMHDAFAAPSPWTRLRQWFGPVPWQWHPEVLERCLVRGLQRSSRQWFDCDSQTSHSASLLNLSRSHVHSSAVCVWLFACLFLKSTLQRSAIHHAAPPWHAVRNVEFRLWCREMPSRNRYRNWFAGITRWWWAASWTTASRRLRHWQSRRGPGRGSRRSEEVVAAVWALPTAGHPRRTRSLPSDRHAGSPRGTRPSPRAARTGRRRRQCRAELRRPCRRRGRRATTQIGVDEGGCKTASAVRTRVPASHRRCEYNRTQDTLRGRRYRLQRVRRPSGDVPRDGTTQTCRMTNRTHC